jgi:ubiquinone/menaquinone biosynthesis C-methylase UbiE
MSYGIKPGNLKTLDHISYSPWITTGDMHDIPFEDNSFDVLILGWVIGYSRKPERVAEEIISVSRPGAIVSIGNDCYTKEATWGAHQK